MLPRNVIKLRSLLIRNNLKQQSPRFISKSKMNRNEEQSQPKFEDARYTAEYNAKPAIKAEVNKAALLCGSSDKGQLTD